MRERKKQQTRRLIFDTASRLFAKRGFDAVTVAEVARVADLSEVTVFNYFPTKEDLFFGGMAFFEETLLEAVQLRDPGESALAAFRRKLLESPGRLDSDEGWKAILKSAPLINASAALQARERDIVARYTDRLARILARETGVPEDDLEAWTAASALMGTHRALVAFVRARALSGQGAATVAADLRTQARRAFRLLEGGLGAYAVKGSRTRSRVQRLEARQTATP
jgi:AcrR family transcriptional regulator